MVHSAQVCDTEFGPESDFISFIKLLFDVKSSQLNLHSCSFALKYGQKWHTYK